MKVFVILASVALAASVAARHGGGGGGDHGGGRGGGRGGEGGGSGGGGGPGGWRGGDRGNEGDGDHHGGHHGGDDGGHHGGDDGDHHGDHHHGWSNQQAVNNTCPATNRVIIISNYIPSTNVFLNCIGTCNFQSNAVLSTYDAQTYDKTDSVVIMVGPYSSPNTVANVLSNLTLMTSLTSRTNVFVTSLTVYPSVTDATILSNVAAANALIDTALTTPGVRKLDFKTFFDQFLKYNDDQMNGYQMCSWVTDQLIAAGVVLPVPVPVVPAPAGIVSGTTAAP